MDVETFANGVDTTTCDMTRARGPVIVRRCKLAHDIENVTDRGKLVAALRLAAIEGAISVEDNQFLAVPQVGILLDGAASGAPVQINRNVIRPRAVVTNGYALVIVGSRNFEIAGNKISAENGRGIDIDSYRKEPVAQGTIHHNTVEVSEGLNREYREHLETRALRLRNTVDRKGPHHDLLIHDNILTATTGAGLAQKAFAVRVTYQNADGSMNHANVRLERNVLRAVATSPETHAAALALDGFDAGVDLHVTDNILESNDIGVTLGDTEGPVAEARLIGNTIRKVKADIDRPFHAIHAGFWEYGVRGSVVIGPKLENHAALDVDWAGSARKDLAVGQLLNVTVRKGDAPAAGAGLVVEDREGKSVFTGTAGADGVLRAIQVVTVQYRQLTADPAKITVDERGPFQVRATLGGKTVSQQVVLKANQEITLELPPR
jgi:hypothetical protein